MPNARIYSLKVVGKNGGDPGFLKRAIEWCVNEKNVSIDVINISLGTFDYDKELERVCRTAYDQGIMIVAAAGNERTGARFPASYETVISVAAIDEKKEHCRFSNVWSTLDLCAPGKNIFTSCCVQKEKLSCQYNLSTGTSMATPHVTGIVALALSELKKKHVKIDMHRIRDALFETAADLSGNIILDIMKNYDPGQVLLTNINKTYTCMYGCGLVQAKDFMIALGIEPRHDENI